MKILQTPKLSQGELDVLYYLSHGLTDREIGERVFRSEKAIRSRVFNMLKKINCKNEKHLVAEAFRLRIIE